MKWMATGKPDFIAVSLDTRDTTRLHAFKKPFCSVPHVIIEESLMHRIDDMRGRAVAFCESAEHAALLVAALNAYETHTDGIEVP